MIPAAPAQLRDAGSAYLFKRDASTGQWQETQKIVASDRGSGDKFGNSASISGNYVIVGAPLETSDTSGSNTASETGSAYVFERDTSTGYWKEIQKIVASDRQGLDGFGWSVSISGKHAIVGAYGEDHDTTGTSASTTSSNGYALSAGSRLHLRHRP